ncbi:MAG TPA: hypothetical protein VJG49_03045 [Candidatus Nanoarchaeia archaeon]|nr:hypothetical protein [Candidatus Nanoarchaeia archaeon]
MLIQARGIKALISILIVLIIVIVIIILIFNLIMLLLPVIIIILVLSYFYRKLNQVKKARPAKDKKIIDAEYKVK